MTNSPTLATAHGGFPAPVTIVLAVVAVGFVLWTRMKGQPLEAKRLLVLPVVLVVIGITDLTGTSAPHLSRTDVAFLAAGVAISVVLGAARGATMELYPKGGELWQRYRPATVALWIALIAAKLILGAIAGAAGASGGGGTNSLLLTLGVSLLAEAAVVGPRALSTGVPFAADQKKSDGHRPRPAVSRPWSTEPVLDVAPPPQRFTSTRADDRSYDPAPSHDQSDRWTPRSGAHRECATESTGSAVRSTSREGTTGSGTHHHPVRPMTFAATTTITTTTATATSTGSPALPERIAGHGTDRLSRLLRRLRLRGRHPHRPAVRGHLGVPAQRCRETGPTELPGPGRGGVHNADRRAGLGYELSFEDLVRRFQRIVAGSAGLIVAERDCSGPGRGLL